MYDDKYGWKMDWFWNIIDYHENALLVQQLCTIFISFLSSNSVEHYEHSIRFNYFPSISPSCITDKVIYPRGNHLFTKVYYRLFPVSQKVSS